MFGLSAHNLLRIHLCGLRLFNEPDADVKLQDLTFTRLYSYDVVLDRLEKSLCCGLVNSGDVLVNLGLNIFLVSNELSSSGLINDNLVRIHVGVDRRINVVGPRAHGLELADHVGLVNACLSQI
ncbi:uncharacterized protein LY79DRAFT_584960 [Colletotrichum navitas]|uniref:Uncharacterized protein n=1 Tax=Colletotrichum navitas TaxID=681940 RepID=A0AAD8PL27_9PEZI|nr:uncharacterized protein LY79DRAFT_584960 [Colletotrichum navitas]KAK1566170.1 hypothetical protein LY79DRAFT_584960 [Colletotrichum navitas]